MAASALRTETLADLRAARQAMLRPEFLAALEREPAERRREAGHQLLRVQLAYTRLREAELSDIRRALNDNGEALRVAAAGLREAMTRLHETEALAAAAAGLLKVVGSIVALMD